MNQMAELARPYANPGNVMDVLRRYRRLNLPTTALSANDLSVAGVPAGALGRTFGALQFLGLIDADKEITDSWRTLSAADDEEFKEHLGSIVRNAYADIFTRVQPETDSQSTVLQAFQRYEPKSQISRMATLFLALCRESGIPTLDTPKQRPTRVQTTGRARGAQPSNARSGAAAKQSKPKIAAPPASDDHADYAVITALVHRLPKTGQWTRAERDKWIAAITAVTDMVVTLREEDDGWFSAGLDGTARLASQNRPISAAP
jgi:Family of unknown function (DUF5343)